MITYDIVDSKRFNYSSDEDINVRIDVYESGTNVYSVDVFMAAHANYFTSITHGWHKKTVVFINKNTNQICLKFEIKGIKNSLSPDEQTKMLKYVKTITLVNQTELCSIMNKNKSDKASKVFDYSNGHNYTKYYNEIFEKFKFDEINFFELGIGTNNTNYQFNMGENGHIGASIFGWSEYFRYGNIFAADIDTDCIFNTDRIRTFYCDQTNPLIIRQMWDNKYLDFKFDIIIEDGLHTFNANVMFFENSYHKLKSNGIYIIEDIDNDEIPNWLNKFEEYESKFPQYNFELIQLECDHNRVDNNLIKITLKHDC